jgi:hypothetical protein
LFHVYREGLLISNPALGEYLLKANWDESFEIMELTNAGELRSLKILSIPERGITYDADHFLINDTLDGKLVVYRWERFDLVKYHEIEGAIKIFNFKEDYMLYGDMLYYHYTNDQTRTVIQLDLQTLRETELGASDQADLVYKQTRESRFCPSAYQQSGMD